MWDSLASWSWLVLLVRPGGEVSSADLLSHGCSAKDAAFLAVGNCWGTGL